MIHFVLCLIGELVLTNRAEEDQIDVFLEAEACIQFTAFKKGVAQRLWRLWQSEL